MVRGTIRRRAGRITGVRIATQVPLQAIGVRLRRNSGDSEGLATHDGDVFVSFEGSNDVWRYSGRMRRSLCRGIRTSTRCRAMPGWRRWPWMGTAGFTRCPNAPGATTGPFRSGGYDEAWRKVAALSPLPRRADSCRSVPISAPMAVFTCSNGPSAGFRVSEPACGDSRRGKTARPMRILIESRTWRHDNLEGHRRLARGWRRDPADDDLGRQFQRASSAPRLVEYRLPDPCAAGSAGDRPACPHRGPGPSPRNLAKTGKPMTRTHLPGILAMAAIVLASNILVQFLFGQWLTWGAFTYPLAFLVTDLMNRLYGVEAARKSCSPASSRASACSLIGTRSRSRAMVTPIPLVTLRIAVGFRRGLPDRAAGGRGDFRPLCAGPLVACSARLHPGGLRGRYRAVLHHRVFGLCHAVRRGCPDSAIGWAWRACCRSWAWARPCHSGCRWPSPTGW